jgi:hypothetical protein
VAHGDEYFTTVIRIFPDYAGSVIWFAMGPVSYDDAKISSQLRRDMEAWEDFYYPAQTEEFGWRRREDGEWFTAEGRRLAERLAGEVGSRFEVEFRVYRNKKVRVSSNAEPSNPEAAEAFESIAREFREFDERIERDTRAGSSFGWFAYGSDEDPDEKPR